MTTRALVLSGGGPVGIAWESGLIGGLAKAGIDLSQADFFLGTSAGAFVGSRLARGTTPEKLAAPFLAMQDAAPPATPPGETTPAPAAAPSTALLLRRMEQARSSGRSGQDVLADIGAFALEAQTVGEEEFIRSFGREFSELAPDYWPERGFACTAIDAKTGEFRLWSKGDGAGLGRAVASSCSVPGVFPPITIAGRRYMDGGVRSGSNADQAAGYDRVVVIAIRAGADGPLAERARIGLEAEIKVLTDAGSTVEVIYPDAGSIAAFGPNMMDSRRRPAAARAGYEQGLAGSAALSTVWAN